MSFKKLVIIFKTLKNSINFVTLVTIVTFLVSSSFYLECQCLEQENSEYVPSQVQPWVGETKTGQSTSSEYHPQPNYYYSPVDGYSDTNSSYQNDFYYSNSHVYPDSLNYNQNTNDNNYYYTATTTPAPDSSYDNNANEQSFNSFNNTPSNGDQNSNNNNNYYYSDENIGRDVAQNNDNYNDYGNNDMTMNQEELPHTVKKIRIIRPPNGFQRIKLEKAYPHIAQTKEKRRSESIWAPLAYNPEDPDSRTIGETLMQTAMFPVTFFAFSMIFMDIMHRLMPVPGFPNLFGLSGFGTPTTTTTPAPQITKIEFKPPKIPDFLGGLKEKLMGKKARKKGFLDSSEENYNYRRRGLPFGKRNRKKRKKSKKGSQLSLKRLKQLYKQYLPSNAVG